MKCIIIEDQPPAQRVLKKYIGDYGRLELVGTFTDAIDGMAFLQGNPVDLVFLDIHLPKLSGIEFLKTYPQAPAVILTTAFATFALESYELDVVDYLLKPFSFARFVKAVSKVPSKPDRTTGNEPETASIFIKSGHEFVKVVLSDILYIQSDNDYTEIFLPDTKLLSSESLKHWEKKLSEFHFIRTHKSYLVNASKITKIRSNHVLLGESNQIPLGRAYKPTFLAKIDLPSG